MPLPKQAYVTEETLTESAHAWLERVRERTGRRPKPLPEGNSALLLIDMQRFFLDPESRAFVPASQAIRQRLVLAIQWARQAGIPVAATRHGHEEGANLFPMDHLWRQPLMASDEWADIDKQLISEDIPVFDKQSYSAFQSRELLGWLQSQQVRKLFLAGVTSHLCVESTARDAVCHGLFPIMLADACAAWTERQQLRALEAVEDGIGKTMLLEDLLAGDVRP